VHGATSPYLEKKRSGSVVGFQKTLGVMERSGPSIETKIVTLVAAVLVVHDLILLAMYLSGAAPGAIQITLGGVLIIALIVAAVWGNSVARAIHRLAWACKAARNGDLNLQIQLPRSDELGALNEEINELIVCLRDMGEVGADLELSEDVADALSDAAPDLLRASQEILVSMKELKEGSGAEASILGRSALRLSEARGLVSQVSSGRSGAERVQDIAAGLQSIGGLRREIETMSDRVMDEVARPEIDATELARVVNGLRDASRILADVAGQAIAPLERREADARAAVKATDQIAIVDEERIDATRVAELMQKSASSGIGAATRLASSLRRLGVALEAHGQRQRVERRRARRR
jgi:methyl-accepting chemotaxis protein